MKKLKYDLPNVSEYDIGDYLDLDELQIIAGDFGDTDYDNFTDEQKERYHTDVRLSFFGVFFPRVSLSFSPSSYLLTRRGRGGK